MNNKKHNLKKRLIKAIKMNLERLRSLDHQKIYLDIYSSNCSLKKMQTASWEK